MIPPFALSGGIIAPGGCFWLVPFDRFSRKDERQSEEDPKSS